MIILSKTALILTIGKATEPSIKRINQLKPDLVYFIHSKKSKENSLLIIEETEIDNYKFKLLSNHEDLEDSFTNSLECINELEKENYEISIDFTVGTKPMVAGLAMASTEKGYKPLYLGESDENSRHEDMGPVKSGMEETKIQENPYENYAINEFKGGRNFFDKYQFLSSYENFLNAKYKLKYPDLKERLEIFIKIVSFYDAWDKFNDEINNVPLNIYLENEIINEINNNVNLKKYFSEEIPHFHKQIWRNHIFLSNKLSNKLSDSLIYYLPDLLNNAKRRIDEGKYDDAVARLYRTMELTSQIRLNQYNLFDISCINDKKTFSIDKNKVKHKLNKSVLAEIDSWNPYGWDKNSTKFLDLDLSKSYRLLKYVSRGNKYNLSKSTKKIVSNFYKINPKIQKRNTSILAHGLRPLTKKEAEELFKLVLNHSKKLHENIEKEMEMAKFPLFKGD